MFLLEGSDDIGKSTVAKKLVAYFQKNFPIWDVFHSHMSRPTDSFNFGSHYLLRNSPHAVQDRFHLGGIIYHTDKFFVDDLHHPASSLTPQWLSVIDSVLALQGSFVVVMTADLSLYCERLQAERREQMFNFEDNMNYNVKWHQLARGEANGFKPRIDVHWNATRGELYPSDRTIEEWAGAWFTRLLFASKQLASVLSQHPISFPYLEQGYARNTRRNVADKSCSEDPMSASRSEPAEGAAGLRHDGGVSTNV